SPPGRAAGGRYQFVFFIGIIILPPGCIIIAAPDPPERTHWPRSSPPLFAAVWTFAYHLPASRSAICASVSVTEPVTGLVGFVPIGTATRALAPGAAGPWKCAAVAGPLRPKKVIV